MRVWIIRGDIVFYFIGCMCGNIVCMFWLWLFWGSIRFLWSMKRLGIIVVMNMCFFNISIIYLLLLLYLVFLYFVEVWYFFEVIVVEVCMWCFCVCVWWGEEWCFFLLFIFLWFLKVFFGLWLVSFFFFVVDGI